jgi:hypothetical protein
MGDLTSGQGEPVSEIARVYQIFQSLPKVRLADFDARNLPFYSQRFFFFAAFFIARFAIA